MTLDTLQKMRDEEELRKQQEYIYNRKVFVTFKTGDGEELTIAFSNALLSQLILSTDEGRKMTRLSQRYYVPRKGQN